MQTDAEGSGLGCEGERGLRCEPSLWPDGWGWGSEEWGLGSRPLTSDHGSHEARPTAWDQQDE